jgi:hypothetical protein
VRCGVASALPDLFPVELLLPGDDRTVFPAKARCRPSAAQRRGDPVVDRAAVLLRVERLVQIVRRTRQDERIHRRNIETQVWTLVGDKMPWGSCSLSLWVPNSSSTLVTGSFTRQCMSGMIVPHAVATAASKRPAAGGMAWFMACVRAEESASPQTRESPNRQQKHATTSAVVPDCDQLMAVGSNRPRIALIYYDTTTDNLDTALGYYEDQQNSIAAHQRPLHHHAAMTGRSSLLAAVMPIPIVRRRCFLITGTAWRAPAQVTTSSPSTRTKNVCKLIVVAQSHDAD